MKKTYTLISCLVALALTFGSCSVDEANLTTDAQKVIERIDIKIESSESEYFFHDNIQENTTIDLVDFNIASPSSIDFIVHLDSDKTILINLNNKLVSNAWEIAGESYGTFAPQDLNTKYKYVTIQYMDGPNGESKTFASNIGENIPQGGFLDVFRIEKYSTNDMEMLCRINSMTLYQEGNTNNKITIDGTFRGALTFIQ